MPLLNPITAAAVLALCLVSASVSSARAQVAQLAPFRGFNPTPNDQSDKPELVRRLRQGGHIIFIRHARTEWSQGDADRQNLTNCATQRNLSEVGRAQSISIGQSFKALGIPIGAVVASPYCRTLETARLAFGRAEQNVVLRHLFPEDQANFTIVGTRLRTLLDVPTRPGCNTVLVSHGFNFRAVHGFDPGEGEAAIVQPDGRGGHAYVGRLTSDDLATMAASSPALGAGKTGCDDGARR
jgi:phosphohistidine phosphatase SixA